MKKLFIFNVFLMILYLVSSCLPFGYYKRSVEFKNCTGDTLIIGHSYFDAIDSVHCQILPAYDIPGIEELDSINVPVNKELSLRGIIAVFPDSTCCEDSVYLFSRKDTCYFFLIKFEDVKRNSWKDICAKKLYHKWMVVRDKNGNLDKDIRYEYE